jgi:hypothetical protein
MGRKVRLLYPCNPPPHREDRTPLAITDPEGMVYVYLAGRPLSESYTSVIKRSTDAIENARNSIVFRDKQKAGRRGNFYAINVGVSSGNGNSVCPCRAFLAQNLINSTTLAETSHA